MTMRPQVLAFSAVLAIAAGCGSAVVKQRYQPLTIKVAKAPTPAPAAKLEKTSITISEKVLFHSGSSRLREESFHVLEEVAKVMQENPQVTVVQIEGHTDDVGKTRKNQKLSQKRAESVRQFLIDQGVAPERLLAKGFGEEKPIADNDDEDGRERNRRVEFNIVSQGDTMAKK